MTKFEAVLVRFFKGFIGSAIPTILAAMAGITQFNSVNEFRTFCIALAVPLATGALLAVEKALNWEGPINEPKTQIPS